MSYPGKFSKSTFLGVFGSIIGAAVSHGTILVDLDPKDALYDSDVTGVVADGGDGPGVVGHLSGIPVLDTAEHLKGFTFNIAFTPTAADLKGTRLLIEIGALSNGSGLYLIDGVPTFVGKQGGSDASLPTSLNDTALNTIAVQSAVGKLTAATGYSFSVSWNQAGTLELIVAPDGGTPLLNSFAISGTPGNWSGNDTLSVKTLGKANAGGLSGNNATNIFGPPFDVDDASSLAGTVSRALFWNANSVTPLQLTPPVVQGFQVTRLPGANQLRLHWKVTEGGLANPTTLVIKDTDTGNTVYTPPALEGFADIPVAVTHFSLTATNASGTVGATSNVEADTPFSAAVRADAPNAWFRFNDSVGSLVAVDSAENTTPHDAHLLGGSVAGATGFVDQAGAFEGGSAVVGDAVLNPGIFDPDVLYPGFSVEAIVRRRPGLAGNHVLVSQTDVEGTGRVILGVSENGSIYSQIGAAERKEADETLPPDQWAHLVIVVDAGTPEIRWYLDGKKVGSTLDGTNPGGSTFVSNFIVEASQGNWVLGSAKSLAAEFWKGDIDEVAVYPKLLDDINGDGQVTDSRIAAHRDAWYSETSGIIYFGTPTAVVSTGESANLNIKVGADVTSVVIDNGIGAVAVVNGSATVAVSPSATTTYQLTASGPNGSYTKSVTVTYQQLTVPVILGFEATALENDGVRLHWSVSPGVFPTATTVELKSGSTLLLSSTSAKGFLDVPAASATSLTLTAKNLIGSVNGNAPAVAPDTAFGAAVRLDAPVAWYRFNEAAGSKLVVDSAVTTDTAPHDGTPLGASVAGGSGFVDGAGNFDGTNGIVADRILDPGVADPGYTIEAIVQNNPGTTGTNRAIIAQQDLTGTGRLILSVDDNGVSRTVIGAGIRKDSDGVVLGKTWSHLVLVVDALNTEIRWYIDGQFAGTSKDGKNPDGSEFDPAFLLESSQGAWTIGVHKTLTGNFWKGAIDEVVVYNTLLDDPNADGDLADSRVPAHRAAWWSESTGLIYAGSSAAAINPGSTANLDIKVGADVTSVTIDNGVGAVTPVNGNVTVPLHPSATTTYQVTVEGPGGPYVKTITITVNAAADPLSIVSSAIESGNFVIHFKGNPSTTYAVRGSADLTAFGENLGTSATDASGNGTVSIPVDSGKAKQFFRIEAQP